MDSASIINSLKKLAVKESRHNMVAGEGCRGWSFFEDDKKDLRMFHCLKIFFKFIFREEK